MTRVKMNAKHEYEFIANFKVMQNVFKSKRIEKARLASFRVYSDTPYLLPSQPIPVEKLVKCKMQCVAFSRLVLFLGRRRI
jgi:RP/EB family microtubule-associated protein